MKSVVLILCGLLSVGFSLPAQAAGFACAKASTAVEKMICADAELSKLDEEMAAVYKPINPRIADPEASMSEIAAAYKQMAPYIADPVGYRMEQRDWLKVRNACKDAGCVRQSYQTRLAALRMLAQGPKPCFRLLERKWPQIQSGHYPVCVDVLKSMNKLCAELPLCEWKVDPSVTSLSLPQWEELDPKKYLKLIQHTYQKP
ncbi:MAG: lysozyme inhibitor LprI family protein, partial [Proteobacteria bacterium]|nr:lysozyme inhibitor LprI family protein [Pseudomonadota bacterium]